MYMSLAIAMLLFGGFAGFIGWRRATKPIYRRSLFDDVPTGVDRREHERATIRRRKMRRLVTTILYALAGAALGAIAWAFLTHGSAGVPAVGIPCCVARNLSRKWRPEVVGGYFGGLFGSVQLGKQATTAS
jgi:hypothetical protein